MPDARTNRSLGELLVELDRRSPTPAHVQLEALLRNAVRSGRLAAGSVVPASRRLAAELGLSRGVVVEAYQQLTAEGYLISTPGGYTRVAHGVAAAAPTDARPAGPSGGSPGREPAAGIDFRYGRPDVSRFPREAWLRSVRTVLARTPHDRLTYLDGRGAPELREALAEYLNRVRGTWAVADDIVACNGYAQAVSILMPVLVAAGVRRIAVEDPSDDSAVRVARAAGMEVVGIPVGAGGIDVGALAASGAQAVVVTPAHQFPTGCVMAPETRTALLGWASQTGGLIVEDDYDAEYRYDQTPVGALHGLAPDRVIYAGTTSKTLAPGLRLGWLVAPPRLAPALAEQKVEVDRGSPVIDQLAFADFVTTGAFDRHLRTMRPLYRRRRDALLAAMADHLPELTPVGIAAGLHVFAWLPADLDELDVIAAAQGRGVIIGGIAGYRMGAELPGGLIFGYGTLDEAGIVSGVLLLRQAIDEVRAQTTAPR